MKNSDLAAVMKKHGLPESAKELDSILHDYKLQGEQLGKMIQLYETEHKPLHEMGIFLCPCCHHRISEYHEHCHWCGARVGWSDLMKKRKKEAEIRGKKRKKK
ncbi:MAG TPA: hypothetical protein H9765_09620 [Candidatus Mediterraneibacter intestinigallinarum]|nr:hypothetical protein [Candidatus Mediterraneibacter intestinigallinarum]